MLLSRIVKNQIILILFLLFGFCLRFIWIIYFPNDLYADSIWYYQQALNLSQGKGYIYNGAPTAIWPVGYPFFLSLIFRLVPPTQFIAKFTNVFLLIVDLWLIFYYTRLSVSTRLAPYVAVLLITFMPTHIFAGSLVATEPLFSCFLHGGLIILLLAIKRQHDWLWILVGGLTGLMIYIKAEALVFLLVVVFFYILSRPIIRSRLFQKDLVLLVLIIIAALIIILPWTIRNYISLGMFVPISTTGCMNIWIGHAPGSDGGYYWSTDPAVNPVLLREDDTEKTWYRRSCQAAIQAIRSRPLNIFALWPKKVLKLWQDDRGIISWNLSKTTRKISSQQVSFLYTITDSYYYVILFFGLMGIVWQLHKIKVFHYLESVKQREAIFKDQLGVVGIMTTLAFTFIYLLFFGASRFHFALTPLLAVYAADFLVINLGYFKFRLFQ